MDPAILEKIGFTRTESIVYLTLLQTGTCKTGDLLKQAGLNSGKIYEILENLKTKALVSESIINQVKHFTAAPPAKLLEYVEKKKIDLEKEETAIRSMLPQLNVLRKVTSQRVKAVTYLGLQGIRTALEECLESMKPSEESLVMGATGKKDPKINAFLLRFQLKRIQRKITMRMIFSERAAYFKQFQLNSCHRRCLWRRQSPHPELR